MVQSKSYPLTWRFGSMSIIGLFATSWLTHLLYGDSSPSPNRPTLGCVLENRFFEEEVWAKVGERTCLRCHNKDGDAAESDFLLSNPGDARDRDWLKRNQIAFERMAASFEGDDSRLLLKASGDLDHGGGQVLKPESTGYQVLSRFVRRQNEPSRPPLSAEFSLEDNVQPFFEGVTMLTPRRLLRRVTLSLAGRLPTSEEISDINQNGLASMEAILDRLMRETAFYERLKEGFNDIFLTLGVIDNAETLLSYDHFEHTRLWVNTHELPNIPEAEREKARWALADVYRKALLREPMELIEYIVRNDRPFSELATADYIMVSPYTARGYGAFEELRNEFKNPDDPFEFIPAKLKALKNRAGQTQESATGLYPHAGILGTFHYLRRYPTTETNRNRLRARMIYQHFLGIDIMQLAPRVTDAAAVAAKYEIPTMQAADCVVCHKTIDPVAGLFQDFNPEGHLGPRKEGWYVDMFQSGFSGEELPATERWRALQWLGERVAKDPRFPIAMVEHVYYILFGRKVVRPPEDIDDPMFGARRKAYLEQRRMIESVAERLTASRFNLKEAFKAMVVTDFYRADGLVAATENPRRATELDDIGVVRLISPEQMERKIAAIFGKPWGKLQDELKILYGGIDSQTVTERNADPSGAMGAIQRILANDLPCAHVARDFRLEPAKRILFPQIEPDVLPVDDHSSLQIRKAIAHLYQRLLGMEYTPEDPEIDRAFQLFVGIIDEAKIKGGFPPHESWFCGGQDELRTEDPKYTLRAWRGVVTYLLRQHDFLYE